jgi:HK97 family phage major capsid protein
MANWIDILRPLVVTFDLGAGIIPLETAETVLARLETDRVFETVGEN